jgi:hypothetical protein
MQAAQSEAWHVTPTGELRARDDVGQCESSAGAQDAGGFAEDGSNVLGGRTDHLRRLCHGEQTGRSQERTNRRAA